MTREEAIKDIKENILPIVGGKSLQMAIKALEQPELVTCKDCVNTKYSKYKPDELVWCTEHGDYWRKDGYCSFGERWEPPKELR